MQRKKFINIAAVKVLYDLLVKNSKEVREMLGKPLTLSEKIIFAHACSENMSLPFKRGHDYVDFKLDQVIMQDATAQMALLQFMTANILRVAVPTTVHCDHLIQAQSGAKPDLSAALTENEEIYTFLSSIASKYGIDFWRAGAGIIHQVVLENYAFPGGMIIGTDSHTPNAGGLGMIAVGVGGSDACDVMAGLPWELKMPTIIGVKLTGKLSGWACAKDVILHLAGELTTKGGTDAIIEYFGEGAKSLSATSKGTICNMGAEIGATCSIFPYDEKMSAYLRATGRAEIAVLADDIASTLQADPEVEANPHAYYDRVIEINLDALTPYVNGPFTPDLATRIEKLAGMVIEKEWPDKIEVALIGSCTNSSYEDIYACAQVAKAARANGLKFQCEVILSPGSQMVLDTVRNDGLLDDFEAIGGVVLANACGPCIGQWKRHLDDPNRKNTILTSFNRNFAKRNDGNASTHSFVASPQIVMAMALAGSMSFNPLADKLKNEAGQEILLDVPGGCELPPNGFVVGDIGYQAPAEDGSAVEVVIAENSQRLQRLEPFDPWSRVDFEDLRLLIKVKGKCTTDHISMAGPWLKFRGHLDNISNNMLIGAINAYNDQANSVLNYDTGDYDTVPSVQRWYKSEGIGSVVVGEENYGEGSSREHAAMEPRYLGVKVVLVKSFARIHETNLKKQGMLALTFYEASDYDKIREDDKISLQGLLVFKPGVPLTVTLHHRDGTKERIIANHTYNESQIEWFKAGSALNCMAKTRA